MRLQVFTLIALIMFSLSAKALRNAEKWRNNCENGISRACFEYGQFLQGKPDPKLRAEGTRYVRRACSMAYTPACRAKPPPVIAGFRTAPTAPHVSQNLPTAPTSGDPEHAANAAAPSPSPSVATSTIDPSIDDMKDITELQNYHAAMKKAANGILAKGKATGIRVESMDDEGAQPLAPPPPVKSVWERAGFRATPLMIKLVGARNFRVTGTEPVQK